MKLLQPLLVAVRHAAAHGFNGLPLTVQEQPMKVVLPLAELLAALEQPSKWGGVGMQTVEDIRGEGRREGVIRHTPAYRAAPVSAPTASAHLHHNLTE